jgi:hypothetical protein
LARDRVFQFFDHTGSARGGASGAQDRGSSAPCRGQARPAAGSCRFRRQLDASEPALGPEKDPKHHVSLESNERNFLSLTY